MQDAQPMEMEDDGEILTRDQQIKAFTSKTFVGVPNNRLEVNGQRNDMVRFRWQNPDEIKRTYRPPFVTLNTFSSDKEFKEKLGHDLVPSYPFLPMVMYTSPVVAMIEYDAERPWIHRWTTSKDSLWSLMTARLYIRLVYGETEIKRSDKKKGKAFDAVTARYNKGVSDLEEWIQLVVAARVHEPMRRAGITDMAHVEAKEALDTFAACLCEYTYRLVHLNEKIIYQYMRIASPPDSPFHKRPLETLLTPRHPNGDTAQWSLREVRNGDHILREVVSMEQWFKDKQTWALLKGKSVCIYEVFCKLTFATGLSSVGDLYDPTIHIDSDQIRPQWREGPNYADFVPYKTLWNYCMLLDGDNVLGDVSRGTPCDPAYIKDLRSILKHRDDMRRQREKAGVGPGRFENAQ